MPRLGIISSVGMVPTVHVRSRGGECSQPSPSQPSPCVVYPQEEGEPGREGSHGICLHYLRCVLPGKGASLAALPALGAGGSALLPLYLFPCPSTRLPPGHNWVPWMGKTGQGRRLGSALVAVRISVLIYTAVSSDRLILQLCLEPAAGPGLWMNQLSLVLGFYFIILLQPRSQAAKEGATGRNMKLADFLPCSCAPSLPAWLWDYRRREGRDCFPGTDI